jgi:hypothetical protein
VSPWLAIVPVSSGKRAAISLQGLRFSLSIHKGTAALNAIGSKTSPPASVIVCVNCSLSIRQNIGQHSGRTSRGSILRTLPNMHALA